MFAKLFDTPDGQILAMRGTTEDDDPCVTVYAEPPGLGICKVSLVFDLDRYETSEEAEDKASKCLEAMDAEKCRVVANPLFDAAKDGDEEEL